MYRGRSKFIERLLWEMENVLHMDRLTIFLGRPNGMKGSVSVNILPRRCISCALPNVFG